MCSNAANVGTLPRLASPLFIQLPEPFAHDHHDDDQDDLELMMTTMTKDFTIILTVALYGSQRQVKTEQGRW